MNIAIVCVTTLALAIIITMMVRNMRKAQSDAKYWHAAYVKRNAAYDRVYDALFTQITHNSDAHTACCRMDAIERGAKLPPLDAND